MYLTPLNEECIYNLKRCAKAIDEDHQWLPENG
jgi:hypothetical protein